jgi:hypothetical protein
VCKKIKKLLDVNLKHYGSPLEPGDHPEMDETEFLTGNNISQHQMLVGSAQWAVTRLGRYNIQFAVNCMARFGCAPRDGHMKRMIRIFGYLKYHMKGRLKFDLEPPNLMGLAFSSYNWHEQYLDDQEEIPTDAPAIFPLLHKVHVTCYVDADHAHCLAT